MKCVILAGGSGLRLWPLSRQKYPKQFLKLIGNNTMFQETVLRNSSVSESMMILTNDEFRYIINKQMQDISIENYEILLEEIGRNTAAAITIAALRSNSEDIIFVVAADAKITADEKYYSALNQAKQLAEDGNIVTFGIIPKSSHTGYGYIKYDGNDVEVFKEKPSKELAEEYFKSGEYLWNSGMFMFRACVLLDEMKKYQPDILLKCKELVEKLEDKKQIVLPKKRMELIPSESIDIALIEKSNKIKVVPSYFTWSDVGSLEELLPEQSNDRNIITESCQNVGIINDVANQIVVVNGLKDTVVVNSNDAVYISKLGDSANIKHIIDKNKEYKNFFENDIRVYRPWGFYEIMINSPGYKVKKISVYPGKRLSLQSHKHRSEHWIVVKGIATITKNDEIFNLEENESTYISVGDIHRLANDTQSDVEIIEVAIGDYIDESDIERYEDDFNR